MTTKAPIQQRRPMRPSQGLAGHEIEILMIGRQMNSHPWQFYTDLNLSTSFSWTYYLIKNEGLTSSTLCANLLPLSGQFD